MASPASRSTAISAYVSEFNNNVVYVCAVATDGTGTLSGCTSTGSGFNSPGADGGARLLSLCSGCQRRNLTSRCAPSMQRTAPCPACGGTAGSASNPSSVAFDGSFAYVNNWAAIPVPLHALRG